LINQKADIESDMIQAKLEGMKKRAKVEGRLMEVSMLLTQYRRQFKLEGNEIVKKIRRKLTEQEKHYIIKKRKKCEECGDPNFLTVHHIKPISHGGTHEEKNLKVLCQKCHSKYHRM
jgi:predicted HNH restriction endonuclease